MFLKNVAFLLNVAELVFIYLFLKKLSDQNETKLFFSLGISFDCQSLT